ncbi:hypothetical protein [Nonomuraea endophytica]|uniref:hypothetical protein n=1 Tax=Nonomuraea endophytica TaxID=714136 RepID=UPI0037C9F600
MRSHESAALISPPAVPYDSAERLVQELAERGIDADLQPFFATPAYVSVCLGLVVRCDGLLFSWHIGWKGYAIYDSVSADAPATAAAKLAARYDELHPDRATQDRATIPRTKTAMPL